MRGSEFHFFQHENLTESLINVTAQVLAIDNASLLECVGNHGLINPFTNDIALDQKRHDLLHFRMIGEEDYKLRILYVVKEASVKEPNRRQSLQTFSVKQVAQNWFFNLKEI